MAVYVDDILPSEPDWAIVGSSLRRPDTKLALEPQDYLYTLAIKSGSEIHTRQIGAVINILDAGSERQELIDWLCDSRIRIVSLTVTEKGYCHDPSTGRLDASHPEIVRDLKNWTAPGTAPGLIVRSLELRREMGRNPFTVLSCDNLPSNGVTTKRVLTGLAALRSADLANWINRNVACPSTMVDRIVPATTDVDRQSVEQATGLRDAWPIVAEPFSQWVVEDRFPHGRPAWDRAGALFVEDVAPYELMKLRMLNGSHSMMSYLGYLSGFTHVSETIGDPSFRTLVHGLMTHEVIPTLEMEQRVLHTYRDSLLDRFSNTGLRHRTFQIAMDGSQKIPQRLLGTVRDRLKANLSISRLALGVAGWMRFVVGRDEHGNVIEIDDPLRGRLAGITRQVGENAEHLVPALLGITEIFGTDLPANETFRFAVTEHLKSLFDIGALATVRRSMERTP